MTARAGKAKRQRRILWLLVPLALLLVVGANAHLVYVAVKSQPECVPHVRGAGTPSVYQAAKSSC